MAAPTLAQAMQSARSYLVFFDWVRADLTSRARDIITEAAQNARCLQVMRIEVAGHSDRSGNTAYSSAKMRWSASWGAMAWPSARSCGHRLQRKPTAGADKTGCVEAESSPRDYTALSTTAARN
jgi:hypothetical protein